MKIISLVLALAILICSFCGCAKKGHSADETTDGEATETTVKADKDGDGEPEKDENDSDGTDGGKDTVKGDGEKEPDDTKDSKDEGDKGDEETEGSADTGKGDRPSDTDKDTPSKDTDAKEPEDTDKISGYTDGMVLEAYISVLSGQFYSDYDAREGAPREDLLHVTALFLYSQRQRIISFSEDRSRIIIPASLLEKNLQLLFGDGLKLSDYTSYLDPSMGDSYDSETDTYSFSAYRENWGEGKYSLSMDDAMEYFEKDGKTVLTVTLVDNKGKELVVSYELSELVYEDYLYFRLSKVYVS